MTEDQQGLQLTESFEGLRLESYQDPSGVWTIGYGHTGPDVKPRMTITQEEASYLLSKDLSEAVRAVNTQVKRPLTQNEFDALVDFAFNVGVGSLEKSTLLRKLNAGDFEGAADQFEQWDHIGAQLCAGLLRRRIAERKLFLS